MTFKSLKVQVPAVENWSWAAAANALYSFERVNPVTGDSWPTYSKTLLKHQVPFVSLQLLWACRSQLGLLKLNLLYLIFL